MRPSFDQEGIDDWKLIEASDDILHLRCGQREIWQLLVQRDTDAAVVEAGQHTMPMVPWHPLANVAVEGRPATTGETENDPVIEEAVTAGITLVALWGLKRIRPLLIRGLKVEHEELVLDVEHSLQLDYLVRALAREGITVDHLKVEEEEREGSRQIVLFVKLPPGVRPEHAVSFIDNMPGVRNVDWTR